VVRRQERARGCQLLVDTGNAEIGSKESVRADGLGDVFAIGEFCFAAIRAEEATGL
jgi:hypothetical protein